MVCNQCREENRGYYNYCLNDGKRLKSINKKYVLNSISSESCISCNSTISKYSNYCTECGRIQAQINQKKSTGMYNEDKNNIKDSIKTSISNIDINSKKIENFTNGVSTNTIKRNIMKIDLKESILTAVLMIGVISLIATILSSIYIYELESPGTYITESISQGKITLLSIVSYNIPRLVVDIKMAMMSVINFTVSTGGLIGQFIIIISAIISVCILIKKDKLRSNIELNAAVVAGFYSIMIFGLAFISNTSILLEEGTTLSIGVDNFIVLIISSFTIAFIGTYIGMYIKLKEYRTIYSRMFMSASNIVLFGLFITTIITYLILCSNNPSTSIGYMFTEIIPTNLMFRFVIAVATAPWIFISSNFSSINFMDIDKYYMLDLSKSISPAMILITIIAIICLFIKGRSIKYHYEEKKSIRIIGIFSCIYSLIMGGTAYATKLYISFMPTVEGDYLSEIIYEISYMFEYIKPGFMENYITPIYNTLESGISIGPSVMGTIIGSFVFSFIFVFIGYKMNNRSVQEGGI